MITLVASGIGGSMLLLLRGCLVGRGCGESGIGTGSLLYEIFSAVLIPKTIPGIYVSNFPGDFSFLVGNYTCSSCHDGISAVLEF